MTYDAKEQSVASGTPFECYELVSPVGTYRYTSLAEEVTIDGDVYEPGTIQRGAVEISTVIDSLQTMDVRIPVSYAIAKAYTGRVVPEYLTIRILRAHSETEYSVEWHGEATRYSYAPGFLVVQTQSILQAKIIGASSVVFCQLSCNHRVYDDRCALDPDNFKVSTTVQRIDNIYVTVANLGHAAADLPLARIVNTRTGEERTIYDANSSTKVLTITYPFLDILVDDVVDLILGCDNRLETCLARFNNVARFGGHKFVPLTNPFKDL